MTGEQGSPAAHWFRTFMDATPDVYFRYALVPVRRVAYVSRAIHDLTGHSPEAFHGDARLCLSLIPLEDRRAFLHIARARQGLTTTIRVRRADGTCVPVQLRTVPVIRGRQIVAIEGVMTVDAAPRVVATPAIPEPTPQRLAALLYEVRDLLDGAAADRREPARDIDHVRDRDDGHVRRILKAVPRRSDDVLMIGDVAIDADRMVVTCGGRPVPLTSREVLVLRYLARNAHRVVTRAQLLEHVWGYSYMGDDRTVDVHVSRIRRKLPQLRDRLRAVRHVGYRLDLDDADAMALPTAPRRVANS
jgi:DNA-binding winged helix-turn-helix (wHTH) protein